MAKTVKLFVLIALAATIAFLAAANTANATANEPNTYFSNSFLSSFSSVKGAFITVKTQPCQPNAKVTITCPNLVQVKLEDGSWLGNWSSSATTNTDSKGIAKFRIIKLEISSNTHATITVSGCQQTMRRVLNLKPCSTAPTYTTNILSRPIQVVPEAP